MRLIDADAFVKYMEEKCDPKSQLDPIIFAIVIGALGEQSTAYDISRVVEELEYSRKNVPEDKDYYSWISAIDNAIEIVKHGGVRKDVE